MKKIKLDKIQKFTIDPLHDEPKYEDEITFGDYIMNFPTGKVKLEYFNGYSIFSPNNPLIVGTTQNINIKVHIDENQISNNAIIKFAIPRTWSPPQIIDKTTHGYTKVYSNSKECKTYITQSGNVQWWICAYIDKETSIVELVYNDVCIQRFPQDKFINLRNSMRIVLFEGNHMRVLFAKNTQKPVIISAPPAKLHVAALPVIDSNKVKLRFSFLDYCNNPSFNELKEEIFATTYANPEIPLDMVEINSHDKGYGELNVDIIKDFNSIQYKISNRRDNLFGDSPVLVRDDRANGNVYFGDIHAKTQESDGLNTPDEYYHHAKYVALLDFAAIADHNATSECSFIEEPFNLSLTNKQFNKIKSATEKYNKDNEFSTIHCFEQTYLSDQSGHRNVYFRDVAPDIFTGSTLNDLYEYLVGHKALIIPHHHIIWDTKVNLENTEFARVIEMYSMHCTSEVRGTLFNNIESTSSKAETGQSAREILDLGYKVGFIAASDNHNGAPGLSAKPSRFTNLTYNGGLAAVWSNELKRDKIFDNLYSRHCYATTGTRIYMNVIADEIPMGGIIQNKGNVNLYIKIAGTAPLAKIEIITNDGINQIFSYLNNILEYTVDYPIIVSNNLKWLYVKVTQIDRNMSYSSPIYFENK